MFGKKNHGKVYTKKVEEGRPKRRWVQDITDDLQMSVSDAGHLAYDRALFRRVVKGAKFRQNLPAKTVVIWAPQGEDNPVDPGATWINGFWLLHKYVKDTDEDMADRQPLVQTHPVSDMSRFSARDNGLMQSVVRNVVVNMESVLSDLQGIMGEITTIVEHIDNVTGKIEKNSKTKKESTVQISRNANLYKHSWENSPNYKTDIQNNFYNSQMGTEKTLAQHYELQSGNSNPNILKVNGFSRPQSISLNDDQHFQAPITGKVPHLLKGSQNDATFSFFSKSFSNLPKDGGRSNTQSGAIAIVYPTVINNASGRSPNSRKKTSRGRTSEESSTSHLKEECIEDSTRQKSAGNNGPSFQQQEPLAQTTSFESAHVKGKQMKAKQTENAAHISNKREQAVTSPKQQRTLVKTNHELSQTEQVRGPQNDSDTGDDTTDLDFTLNVKTEDSQSLIDNNATSGLKETVLETSMDRPQRKHLHSSSRSAETRDMLSQERRKSLHSPLHSSPYLPRNSGLQSEFQTSFDSTESDLTDTTDNICLTPVIDYSYLNLVGNNDVLDNPLESLPSEKNFKVYNTQVVCAHKNEHLNQGQTKNQTAVAEVITSSMLSANTSPSQNQTRLDDEALNSPVWAHVYCSEVISGHQNGYCGCYEHVLDSVLENLPCSESPEDVCDDFAYTAALHKTYVIFENEYEEDDWGIGLKFGEQLEDQPSSVHIQDVDGQSCASLEIVDTNMNLVPDNTYNVKRNQQNVFAENRDASVPKEHLKTSTRATEQGKDASITATSETKPVVTESLKLSGTTGDSSSEEKLGVRKSGITNQPQSFNIQQNHKSFYIQHNQIFKTQPNQTLKIQPNQPFNTQPNQTFNLRPNTFKSIGPSLLQGRILSPGQKELPTYKTAATEHLMSGRESPMSLCSLEALSETVSLPEGDYLLASSDDSYSFCSESRFKPSTSIRTARMKKLRREFFKNMYTAAGVEQDAGRETDLVSSQSMCLDSTMSTSFSSRDTVSESGSYQEAVSSYNRNLNPWTAYALVHEHTDYMSDSSSDIFNTTSCSITTSSQDADNDSSLEAQV